jgi:hypothetical protein
MPAHDVGQRLSRMVQQDRAGELLAAHATETTCPECRNKCPVEPRSRQVTSVDGPVEIVETVAHCRRCRQSFFPSAGSTRAATIFARFSDRVSAFSTTISRMKPGVDSRGSSPNASR